MTLSGTVGKAAGEDGEFTLTVGSTVYTLDAGPKWWWGDASPLAAAVGKHVTIAGEQEDGSTNVDVLAIDGKQLRRGGPAAVGRRLEGRRAEASRLGPVEGRQAGRKEPRTRRPGRAGRALAHALTGVPIRATRCSHRTVNPASGGLGRQPR